MPQSIEKKVCSKLTAFPATLKPVMTNPLVFDGRNEKKHKAFDDVFQTFLKMLIKHTKINGINPFESLLSKEALETFKNKKCTLCNVSEDILNVFREKNVRPVSLNERTAAKP